MNLSTLPVVIAIAECRSLSEAARHLGRSQPSTSRLLASLERQLHVELFSRRGGRLTLTPAGEAFVPKARAVVEAHAKAVAAVDTLG